MLFVECWQIFRRDIVKLWHFFQIENPSDVMHFTFSKMKIQLNCIRNFEMWFEKIIKIVKTTIFARMHLCVCVAKRLIHSKYYKIVTIWKAIWVLWSRKMILILIDFNVKSWTNNLTHGNNSLVSIWRWCNVDENQILPTLSDGYLVDVHSSIYFKQPKWKNYRRSTAHSIHDIYACSVCTLYSSGSNSKIPLGFYRIEFSP